MEKCEGRSHRDDISEIDLSPFPFLGLGTTSEIEASAFRNLSLGFAWFSNPKIVDINSEKKIFLLVISLSFFFKKRFSCIEKQLFSGFCGSLYFTDECCGFHIHFQVRGILELRNTISLIGPHAVVFGP